MHRPARSRCDRQTFDVAQQVAKNVAMGISPLRSARLRRPRAGAAFTGSDQVIERYALQALRTLLSHHGSVEDLDVIELGPGDTLASGLALLAAGAASYTVLDRFVPDYGGPQARRWYVGLAEAWPRCFPERPWPGWLDPASFPEGAGDRLSFIPGSVEQARAGRRYDLVCSFQVGEHVADVDLFARLTADLLAPGGLAVHRVDFGPHDCWERYADPLVFLRFPSRLWSAMGSNRGTPNRLRHHQFLDAFTAAGLRTECVDRTHFAPEKVRLDLLPPPFRTMPTESLLTESVIYLCRSR